MHSNKRRKRRSRRKRKGRSRRRKRGRKSRRKKRKGRGAGGGKRGGEVYFYQCIIVAKKKIMLQTSGFSLQQIYSLSRNLNLPVRL